MLSYESFTGNGNINVMYLKVLAARTEDKSVDFHETTLSSQSNINQ